MKEKNIWTTIRLHLLSMFLILGLCTTVLGTAYGRYQQSISKEIAFTVNGAAEFSIITGIWEDKVLEESNEKDTLSESKQIEIKDEVKVPKRLEVSVSEIRDQECAFRIRLISTLGLGLDKAKVSLVVTNTNGVERTYQSQMEVIEKETKTYQEMGPGYEYYFVDNEGEELIWPLNGDAMPQQKFWLEIEGAEQNNLMEIRVIETQQRD